MAYVEPQLPKVQSHFQTDRVFGKNGKNDTNVMKQAKATYRDENKGTPFVKEDACEILRSHAKWDAPEPVDLTECDVPGVGNEDIFGEDATIPRPAGPDKSTRP
nr:hypothetical protein [Tanacetum cinerariifolium]